MIAVILPVVTEGELLASLLPVPANFSKFLHDTHTGNLRLDPSKSETIFFTIK